MSNQSTRIFLLWFLSLCFLVSCQTVQKDQPHIIIKTIAGDIEIELYATRAPKTVGAFLSNVEKGLYKGASFYRILNNENQPSNAAKATLIQGGIWKTAYNKIAALPAIPHESTLQTGILHKDGIISMARQEPGTAKSEFFICVGDQPGFDAGGENNPDKQGYAAFGKVVKGMDIVQRIYQRPETDQAFDPPIPIINITAY